MSFTSTDGGTYIQEPELQLRVGRGVFRSTDLSTARTAQTSRAEAVFMPTVRGKLIHLVLQNFRAGEPWGVALTAIDVSTAGAARLGMET